MLTDWEEQRPRGLAGIRARATSWRGDVATAPWSAQAAPPQTTYRLGEDIFHPTFGDGVVTGVEPGGIVVIRFSRDGSERKLVADMAPLSKR